MLYVYDTSGDSTPHQPHPSHTHREPVRRNGFRLGEPKQTVETGCIIGLKKNGAENPQNISNAENACLA